MVVGELSDGVLGDSLLSADRHVGLGDNSQNRKVGKF